MTRDEFIKLKRAKAEERYDNIFSLDYDERWGRLESVHVKHVEDLATLIGEGNSILDAACGTGKYFGILGGRKLEITGIDQSEKMLEKAQTKYPSITLRKLGLQEMDYEGKFYGIQCMDAMENVFPEDWIMVLDNFHRALIPNGYLYFTVELEEDEIVKATYEKAVCEGLPVVYGEVALEGYHYYPSLEKVRELLKQTDFNIICEDQSEGYQHFICQRR